MTEAWRCFVAIPISDELRAAIASAVDRWRSTDAPLGLRWTDPASWHVTLAFMGATDPRSVPRLHATLRTVAARHGAFELPVGGIGAFPSASTARVVWIGVADPEGTLGRLAADLHVALGLEVSQPFTAHLTLARVPRGTVDLRAWPDGTPGPVGRLVVDEVQLLRSRLGGRQERYEVLAAAPMRQAARV